MAPGQYVLISFSLLLHLTTISFHATLPMVLRCDYFYVFLVLLFCFAVAYHACNPRSSSSSILATVRPRILYASATPAGILLCPLLCNPVRQPIYHLPIATASEKRHWTSSLKRKVAFPAAASTYYLPTHTRLLPPTTSTQKCFVWFFGSVSVNTVMVLFIFVALWRFAVYFRWRLFTFYSSCFGTCI